MTAGWTIRDASDAVNSIEQAALDRHLTSGLIEAGLQSIGESMHHSWHAHGGHYEPEAIILRSILLNHEGTPPTHAFLNDCGHKS
jgi:hypothetical protein